MLCKKAGIPEKNYVSYSAEDCTGMCTNQTIKGGMGGSVGSRADTVKHYKNSKKMEETAESSQESKLDAL